MSVQEHRSITHAQGVGSESVDAEYFQDRQLKNGRRQALRANRTGLEIIYRPIG